MKALTKARLKETILILNQMHRQRCLLFGCIYGIPGIDKKPHKECIYCGEPMPEANDFWGESEALIEFEQYQKPRTEALSKYLNRKIEASSTKPVSSTQYDPK